MPLPKSYNLFFNEVPYGGDRTIIFHTLPMTVDGGFYVPEESAKAIVDARMKDGILWAHSTNKEIGDASAKTE